MSVSENLLLFIGGIGVLQAFVLSCVIYFHPSSDKSVTIFLAFYIASLSVTGLFPIVQHYFPWQNMLLIEPFLLLTGPFLYLYIRGHKEVITWRKAMPHMALFFVYVVVNVFLYVRFTTIYPLSQQQPADFTQRPIFLIKMGIRVVQMITYFFFAAHALRTYQNSIRHIYSETSKISLRWVSWLTGGYIFLILVLSIMSAMLLQFPQHFKIIVLVTNIFPTPYIYMATYMGITQPMLWQLQPGATHEKVETVIHEVESLDSPKKSDSAESTGKAGLTHDKIEQIASRAVALLEKEKIYQEAELTLQDLADRLQLPSYQVSQAINEGIRKNFYDLVNGYRVEEAKKLLLDPRNSNYKILSVGFEAGFNSKTTFNTVFKKFTGLTPTDFRERHKTVLTEA